MNIIKYTLIKYFGVPNDQYNYLYHFYKKGQPPFRSIFDLNFKTALEYAEYAFANHLTADEYFDLEYFERRFAYEAIMKKQFIEIGGTPKIDHPYYCTLGYGKMFNRHKNKEFIRVSIRDVDLSQISFTYGDSFPCFNKDNSGCKNEYYSRVFNYQGIMNMIEKYGKPKKRSVYHFGYETYIEAQIWDREMLCYFR